MEREGGREGEEGKRGIERERGKGRERFITRASLTQVLLHPSHAGAVGSDSVGVEEEEVVSAIHHWWENPLMWADHKSWVEGGAGENDQEVEVEGHAPLRMEGGEALSALMLMDVGCLSDLRWEELGGDECDFFAHETDDPSAQLSQWPARSLLGFCKGGER